MPRSPNSYAEFVVEFGGGIVGECVHEFVCEFVRSVRLSVSRTVARVSFFLCKTPIVALNSVAQLSLKDVGEQPM